MKHKCSVCEKSNIKLYRPYGEFLRNSRVRCKKHIPAKERKIYVLLVEDEDGSVWGYTSAPQKDIDKANLLPER